MTDKIKEKLSSLIKDLDSAIYRIVENPLLFEDITLKRIEATCSDLMALHDRTPTGSESITPHGEPARCEELLWEVRTRSGRLRMLMDSAARFYSSCFSLSEPEDLAYGVHGEWSTVPHASHVVVDC